MFFLVSCEANLTEDLDEPMDDFSSRSFIQVSSISGSTSETGGTATFNLSLTLQPDSDVSISIQSSDTSEGVVSPATVTFTSQNWDTKQTITVTGADDEIYDLTSDYQISFPSFSSDDPTYNNLEVSDTLTVSNTDDETPLDALAAANFTVLRTGGSCPSGFEDGYMQLDAEDTNNRTTINGAIGDTEETNNTVTLRFCSTTTPATSNLTEMESRGFLVLRSNGSCPEDYNRGLIGFDTENDNNANSHSGDPGDSYTDSDFATIYTCDSSNDTDLGNLKVSSFTIFRNGDCPDGSLAGMLKIDTEDSNNADQSGGNTGSSYLSSDNTWSAYLLVCTFQ